MAPATPRRCASVPCLTTLHVDPAVTAPACPGGGGGSAPREPLVLFHGHPPGDADDAAAAAAGLGSGGGAGEGSASPRHGPDGLAPLLFTGDPPGAPVGAANSVVSAAGMGTPAGGGSRPTAAGAVGAGTGGGDGAAGGDGGTTPAAVVDVAAAADNDGGGGGEVVAAGKRGGDGRDRRSLLAAVTMAVSLLGLPGRAVGVTELLASISLRGPLAARHPLWAGLSMAGDVASEALGNVACPPDGAGGLFHDCAPHSAAMLIHLFVDVLNLSPY